MIATLIGTLLCLCPIALQDMVFVDLETGTYHRDACEYLDHVIKIDLADAKKKYKACSCATKDAQQQIKTREGDPPAQPDQKKIDGLVRCQAMTLKGAQCKRTFKKGKFCWQHQRMNTTPTKSTGRCQATTQRGTQCSRNAKTNGYCWQHQ